MPVAQRTGATASDGSSRWSVKAVACFLLFLLLWLLSLLSKEMAVSLPILIEKDTLLLNIYSVMEVNPANGPRVNAAGGKAFADFMLAPETQAVIGTFGVDRYGQPLFVPIAGKSDADFR